MVQRRLFRAIIFVEKGARFLAAVMMLAVMMIVVVDVALRYLFNSPLSWAYDFVSLYLMVGIFFLILSDAYVAGAHVSVDLLQQHMSPLLRSIVELTITSIGFVVFALIAYVGAHQLAVSFSNQDVLAGAIPWPTWPGHALVPFGAGLLAIRLLLHFGARAASLLSGLPLISEARMQASNHGVSE